MWTCPVCGGVISPEAELEYEDETFTGAEGAEIKITIPYCNQGKECSAVEAANVMDRLAEPFFDAVGHN